MKRTKKKKAHEKHSYIFGQLEVKNRIETAQV